MRIYNVNKYILVSSFRIFWKPTFFNPILLLKEFSYTP